MLNGTKNFKQESEYLEGASKLVSMWKVLRMAIASQGQLSLISFERATNFTVNLNLKRITLKLLLTFFVSCLALLL